MTRGRDWFHWSSSGDLISDPLHVGTLEAALARRDAICRIPWDAPDLEVPSYWRPGEHSRLYRLDLLRPPVNLMPVRDDKVYDYPGEPVLYVNAVEGEGSVSCCAPLECWRVLEVLPG